MLTDLQECCDTIFSHGVVAIHTETVYGLAANALSVKAVKKIYETKGRPRQNPLIVHILESENAEEISFTNDYYYSLTERFWPGPLSLILPVSNKVPRITTGGMQTVAIRSPQSDVFRDVLRKTKLPLAAPSANPSNRISPTCADHVISGFKKNCPKILDGGKCSIGIESTVLDISGIKPVILRPGPIGAKEIEDFLGIRVEQQPPLKKGIKSPGLSPVHYSPITPTLVYENTSALINEIEFNQDDIFIFPFKNMISCSSIGENVITISESNDSSEVSRRVYSTLHAADRAIPKTIRICLLPEINGLASALNDRIRRTGKIIFKE